jgi:hypothetical protein
MSYENKGIIFENKYKTTDRHPDYKGRINFNGVEYDLGAWYGTTRNGDKMLSLKVGEVYDPNRNAQPQTTVVSSQPATNGTDFIEKAMEEDDQLPF